MTLNTEHTEQCMTIKRMPNNVFVKEICFLCSNVFKADRDYIYYLDINEIYNNLTICYDCVDFLKQRNVYHFILQQKIKLKELVLMAEFIDLMIKDKITIEE